MDETPPFSLDALVQTHPGLAVLRLAALLAEGGAADEDTLDLLFERMEAGAIRGKDVIEVASPAQP